MPQLKHNSNKSLKFRWRLLHEKIRLSFKSSWSVLTRWRYAVLAVLVAYIFIQILYWLLNASLFWYFLSVPTLNIPEKIEVFSSIVVSYLGSLPLWQAITVIVLSLVQGAVIAVLTYTIRSQQKIDKKAFGGSTLASVVAMFSVGCVSCGTSIIAPIVGIFASGATASLSEAINKVAIVIGLLIAIYALYAVGLSAARILAQQAMDAARAALPTDTK